MKNLLLLVLLTLPLAACQTVEPLIKTEYVEKKVPVNAVPSSPKVARPIPETSLLTEADRKDLGIVAKAVAVEKDQWKEYSFILESIINKYNELADKSEIKTVLNYVVPEPAREEVQPSTEIKVEPIKPAVPEVVTPAPKNDFPRPKPKTKPTPRNDLSPKP